MLTSLSIKNFALIDDLNMSFNNGLSVITGETGAGKSIILGALSLILGKRADVASVKESSKKCVVEGIFDIANYNLKSLFVAEDLDYEAQTILRREILPSGKSRAFINDSPVTLDILKLVGNSLFDIHSQHETLSITNQDFQFNIIDALAHTNEDLEIYSSELKQYKSIKAELESLLSNKTEFSKELDYNNFLLKELEDAKLDGLNLEALEEEFQSLNNVEAIKENLAEASQLLSDEQLGALTILRQVVTNFNKLENLSGKYVDLAERLRSAQIELDDVISEIESQQDALDANPELLIEASNKLELVNNLLNKHSSQTVEELLHIQNELYSKVEQTLNIDETILEKETAINTKEEKLNTIAKSISDKRLRVLPELINQLEILLSKLGMQNAKFNVSLTPSQTFLSNGKDALQFLFSANKGSNFKELKKVASGGELSRIMLAVKYVMSKHLKMPTIMFDEIDTGVSGEVSNQIAVMLRDISKTMQVFSITHTPQIAAKGHSHFKVYKEDVDSITRTQLVKLKEDERIVEIAQMLGGTEISDSAVAHAKQLLN